MAIIQISKIQHRSGDLVDLPQLSEAEFGFASDARRLFIGKTDGNIENIEVLTSYSAIDFNQIEGSIGNLNISNTVANGEVLAFDGNNWVNRGGNAGGLITLGDVSNVKIDGGAIGYVLETDGTGNLSWTPKGIITLGILNVSQTDTAVVTLVNEFSLTNNTEITINNIYGQGAGTDFANLLNGQTYYVQTIPGSPDQYELYTSPGGVGNVDATAITPPYPYATVVSTDAVTDEIEVGDSSPFANTYPVVFTGNVANTGLQNEVIYYICDVPDSTHIVVGITSDGNIGNKVSLTPQAGLSANVYTPGGKIITTVSGGGSGSPGGSNGSIQFNFGGILSGDSDLSWDSSVSPKILTANANVNTGNINANGTITGTRLISNIATGTAPLQVSSTTRVGNLSVAYANVSDFGVVTSQTTGTYYPVFVNSSSTGNLALGSNSNLSFNAATGNLSATLLTGTLTTASQPNVTSFGNGTHITAAGNLNPNANVTYSLGNSTNRWNNLYLSGSTIYLGNATITSNSSGVVITNATGGSFTIGGTSAANGAAIVNGNSNVIVTANANVNISSNGVSNVLVVTSTGANITGTLNATGNANVGNLGATRGVFTNIAGEGGNISNIQGANVSGTVATATTAGTVTTAAQPNITSVGTLSSLAVTANITAGNVYANSGTIGAGLLAGTLSTAAQPNVTSVGTLTSLSATGNVTAGNLNTTSGIVGGSGATLYGTTLTTGANVTPGTITGNWTLSSGSRLQSTYADLAEYYCADGHYTIGTVLEFGGEQEVTMAGNESSRIAGVVSDQPAYVMNANIQCEYPVPVALIGRVPCKVKGKVRKGDMLVSAGDGFAKVNSITPKMGTVIGKALADFDGVEGVIEIVVGRL